MKYKVTSVALDPRTWERTAVRTEVIDVTTNDVFKLCVNGRAVGAMYEFYWNHIVDTPVAVVKVTGVQRVG